MQFSKTTRGCTNRDNRGAPGVPSPSIHCGHKYLTSLFYCYFQEHFFYFQEAELRMDVLQQHAALMGGASTTSCPLCHKLFLGSESLVEHMKAHHGDPATVSQAVVQSEYRFFGPRRLRPGFFCSAKDAYALTSLVT